MSRFAQAAAATLLAQLALAAVSIAVNWPSQFDGVGTDAREEFATRGTAVAPPLLPMAVFAAAVVMSARTGRARTLGTVVVCLMCTLFLVGSLGELRADATEDVPRTVLVASGVAGALVYGGLALWALRELLARRPAPS